MSDNVSREAMKELIREHVMTSSSEHRELQASVDALIVASEAAAKKTGSKAMQASADSLRKYRANLERELRDDCPPAWEKLRAWVQLVRDDWNHAGYIMKACAADYILDGINILSPAPAEAAQRCPRCNGNGRIEMLEHCPECIGDGKTPRTKPERKTEMPKEVDVFVGYEEKTVAERLELLDRLWRESPEDRQRAFLEGRMLEATVGLADHPGEFAHGCVCAECLSCG